MMAATMTAAAMTLGELLGPAAHLHAQLPITNLVMDSRQVGPGAAFVAVPGQRSHGLDYADAALAQGAVVVLYEPSELHSFVPQPSVAVPGISARLGELAQRFFAQPGRPTECVGVTGTNGKTTVAYLLAQAFARLGRPCGYIGTLGFGLPPTLHPQTLTTPDCLTLHREIASMGAPDVVLEVSSHALVQHRIAGIDIGTAVFTNLSRDHLDDHGSMDAYAQAKARLFELTSLRRAVLNLDDAFSAELRDRIAAGIEIAGVSLAQAPGATITATVRDKRFDGIELEIAGAHGATTLTSPLIGDFNGKNLLLALGVLLLSEFELKRACDALSLCSAPAGRMEVFGGSSGAPWVVVDYAHTPDALERSLDVLGALAPGRVDCVFGCGGDRDRGKRELMGAVAANKARHIVLTDDNPRTEDPVQIIDDIRRGTGAHTNLTVEHDRAEAIAGAINGARAGDVVLIAGKGHETNQTIGDEVRSVDDRKLVAGLLAGGES